MDNKKKCFVIMPFSKAYSLTKEQWTEIFEHKINLINTHLDLRPVLGEGVEKTLTEVLPGTKETFITLME
jgi:hypothetical protein